MNESLYDQAFLIICLSLLVCFFGLGAYALWLGKEALLSDCLIVITGALGGGGVGYALGRRRGRARRPLPR